MNSEWTYIVGFILVIIAVIMSVFFMIHMIILDLDLKYCKTISNFIDSIFLEPDNYIKYNNAVSLISYLNTAINKKDFMLHMKIYKILKTKGE